VAYAGKHLRGHVAEEVSQSVGRVAQQPRHLSIVGAVARQTLKQDHGRAPARRVVRDPKAVNGRGAQHLEAEANSSGRRYSGGVADYYLVRQARGPAWDPARGRRDQDGWDEHAAFMDALTEEGVVILGGPLGEDTDQDALLIVDVESEAAIRTRLADDPWMNGVLTIQSVEPWTVWLCASAGEA
jgi:uncharacterized protein YciI